MKVPLNVAIDARFVPGQSGGVEQVIVGLAYGISKLRDTTSSYGFLAYRDARGWLEDFVRPPATIVDAGWLLKRPRVAALAARVPGLPVAAKVAVSGASVGRGGSLPASTGLIERLNVQVIHFTTQFGAFATRVPSIYQPHDLQHRHLPEFFTREEIGARESMYRAGCAQAAIVMAMSSWGRRDLLEQYDLDPNRVVVVPWAGMHETWGPADEPVLDWIRSGYGLPTDFLLYPAQAWPHKNHLGLLRALAYLRDTRKLAIPLVCTGAFNDRQPILEAEVRRLRLENQVTFTGFVDHGRLRGLYQSARALAFPSFFEGWGLPIVEAFGVGLPVACSNATMLPDLAAGAALLFDPHDQYSISHQLERVWTDEATRKELKIAGLARAEDFSWTKTALLLRSHYRSLAGFSLNQEERRLMEAPAPV